jgi:hypothetical protein
MPVRAALFEYLSGVGRLWWGFIASTFPAVVGLANDMRWLDAPLPSWVWWTAAIIGYFVAHFYLFLQIWKQRNELTSPRHDVRLKDVVEQIVGVAIENNPDETRAALNATRENANLGYLKSWGRHGSFMGGDATGPLHEIPKDHWSKYQIDFLSYLRDNEGKLGPTNNHDETFGDIWFNQAQVDICWPRKRKRRFQFQWPIKKGVNE